MNITEQILRHNLPLASAMRNRVNTKKSEEKSRLYSSVINKIVNAAEQGKEEITITLTEEEFTIVKDFVIPKGYTVHNTPSCSYDNDYQVTIGW